MITAVHFVLAPNSSIGKFRQAAGYFISALLGSDGPEEMMRDMAGGNKQSGGDERFYFRIPATFPAENIAQILRPAICRWGPIPTQALEHSFGLFLFDGQQESPLYNAEDSRTPAAAGAMTFQLAGAGDDGKTYPDEYVVLDEMACKALAQRDTNYLIFRYGAANLVALPSVN